jgi:hypothetical protein
MQITLEELYQQWKKELPKATVIVSQEGKCECGWHLPLAVSITVDTHKDPERPKLLGYVFACPLCEKRVVKLSSQPSYMLRLVK